MPRDALNAHIVCLPESAGSALYGMVDVLKATGTLWRELTGAGPSSPMIEPRLVSMSKEPFVCGNGIPVQPEFSIEDITAPEVLIVPEMWLAPDDALQGRYTKLKDWIAKCYHDGSTIYSACSGSVILAAAGILDGREATSHWGYEDLFRRSFPKVHFNPQPNLCVGDASGRIITAGGTSSWHDLAIHIISRHANPGEALKIAQVYLMKWHAEGQLPYTPLVRKVSHADSKVREAETWLAEHFREPEPVAGVVAALSIPERSLKRRFREATGTTLIKYTQNLRIEAAKRVLEGGVTSVEEIAAAVGYENFAFFRRLFKRLTGLSPVEYRRMFQPFVAGSAD